jgi:hypothetical protein
MQDCSRDVHWAVDLTSRDEEAGAGPSHLLIPVEESEGTAHGEIAQPYPSSVK